MKQRFKNLIQTNKFFKYIPNSLTLCNSLCGFASILCTLQAYSPGEISHLSGFFAISAAVICFAMVFDALDGFAARIFNAASMHGLQMDSLADMVTFGVAPATLCAVMTHSLRGTGLTEEIVVYLLCSVYLGCAALRLATYNVCAMEEHKSSNYFSGLPSPGAASAVCVAVWLACDLNFTKRELAMVLPVYAAILGLLMVSKIRYLHVGKWLTTVKRSRKKLFLLIVMLAVIAVFRIKGLAALVALYILSGPVLALGRKIFSSGKQSEE